MSPPADPLLASPPVQTPRLTFVGGGNMAEAIIGGLLTGGYPPSHLTVSEPVPERVAYLASKYHGINIHRGENNLAVSESPADVVILAVKPQVMHPVLVDLAATLRTVKPLMISIAGGIRTTDIQRWIGSDDTPLVRAMPNTPALVLEGAAGMYATPQVGKEDKQCAERILGAVSKVVRWVNAEEEIDAVTAVSGSGPAYFFLLMEAMEKASQSLGLSAEASKNLVVQTCLGAARMAENSSDDLATLRMKVTSPNGTTEAALKRFEAGGFRQLVEEALVAANRRSKELAEVFGSV